MILLLRFFFAFILAGALGSGCHAAPGALTPGSLTPGTPTEGGFVLVQNGQLQSVIVIPDSPSEIEEYAAREFMEHVRLATGMKLPIVREGAAEVSKASGRVFIGSTRAAAQAGLVSQAVMSQPTSTEEGMPVALDGYKPSTPDTLEREAKPGLWVVTNREPRDEFSDFIIDLGNAQDISAFLLRNRSDATTNFNPRSIQIEVGAEDDGKIFGQVIYSGAPEPVTNDKGTLRHFKVTASKKRFFKFRVLSNFWGNVSDAARTNAQAVQFQEIRYLTAEQAIAKSSSKSLSGEAKAEVEKLARNGFILRTQNNNLFLVGRDDAGTPLRDDVSAGTLFAVYEWLESKLKARWLWPGELGTVVPAATTVTSGIWDQSTTPPFEHTRARLVIGRPSMRPAMGAIDDDKRDAAVRNTLVWYRRQRFARGTSLDYGHGYTDYWKRYNGTHPEYFNLLPDGSRRPAHKDSPGAGDLVSMSVGTPSFQNQVIENWKQNRTAWEPWVNGWENDTPGLCICRDCLALDARDPSLGAAWENRTELASKSFAAGEPDWYRYLGSMSDRYAHYWLALQKKAQAVDPQAVVIGGAYANYWKPPLQMQLNKNIVVGIVPDTWWPLTDKTHEGFKAQWGGWHKAGARLYLRPNYMLSGHNQPLIFTRQLARDFQFAAKNGMLGTDFDSLTGMWATQGPNLYLLARLHWEPDAPVEKLLDEYYSGFGAAAPHVRKYFEFWERATDATAARWSSLRARYEHGSETAIYARAAGELFSAAQFAEANQMLDAARHIAAGDSEKKRVDFLAAGLEDARLTAATTKAYWEYQQGGDFNRYSQELAQLDRHRRQLANQQPDALNLDFLTWLENMTWDRGLAAQLGKSHVWSQLPVDWQLRWDAKKQGVEERWFATPGKAEQWHAVKTDAPWENQPVGKQWQRQNGAPFDGLAWYRIRFKAPSQAKGKPLRLLFGAVDEGATAWLNGQKIGEHPFVHPDDWRTAFSFDITRQVDFEKENELVVLVEDNAGVGGIWKPVWLVSPH